MGITDYRDAYKPFEYPRYMEYYFDIAVQTVWRPETVSMTKDIDDFNLRISQDEREFIAGILRGFTITETHVSDYWSDRVCRIFPKHEIVAPSRTNSMFEAIHAKAYAHLNDTLGLTNYDAFLKDEQIMGRIEAMVNSPNNHISLAIFSGLVENVTLFSSFAPLLSFCKEGLFKGLGMIISWSIRDENLHYEMGCELFRDYCLENPLTDDNRKTIYETYNSVLTNEFKFIDNLFAGKNIPSIDCKSLKDYILYRANLSLAELGLEPQYSPTGEYNRIQEWFLPLAFGASSNDFFSHQIDGANYNSLLNQHWDEFDYTIFNDTM